MPQTQTPTREQLQAQLSPRPDIQVGDGYNYRNVKDANAVWERANSGILQKIAALNSGQGPDSFGYQDDGSYKLDTNVTDDQAEKMAARVSREQFERYMQRFAPQENAIASTLDDTKAQDAASSSQADAMRSRASLERMRQRYGTTLNSTQRRAESGNTQRAGALGSLSAMNTARQLDEDRNFNMTGTMLNIGNNLSSSAMGGLTTSAQNASARDQAHQQAKASHSAQKSQQQASAVSSIVSLGALALMGGV